MRIIYNLAVILAGWLLYIPALFILRINSFVTGRRNLFAKIKEWRNSVHEDVIWIHCSSLGEFEMARPLIDHARLLEKRTDGQGESKLLITFFSPSGYKIVSKWKKYAVFYMPLDTLRNARRFVDIVQPREVYFVKNEFWFNFLHVLQKRKVSTYLINGAIRRDQVFFKPYGRWFLKHLHAFNHFFVQDDASSKLLRSLAIADDKITVTGDMRYDRVAAIRRKGSDMPEIARFKTADYVIVGGSTWPPEEELLARFMSEHTDCDCIIAPHEVSPDHIRTLEDMMMQFGVKRYSEWDKKSSNFRVLIIDSVGMLSRLYSYGDVAFVGGGFETSLHNILEPAGFGLPVIFGPETNKFPEAQRFVQERMGYRVKDLKSFEKAVKLAQNGPEKEEIIQKMREMQGATERIIRIIRP